MGRSGSSPEFLNEETVPGPPEVGWGVGGQRARSSSQSPCRKGSCTDPPSTQQLLKAWPVRELRQTCRYEVCPLPGTYQGDPGGTVDCAVGTYLGSCFLADSHREGERWG